MKFHLERKKLTGRDTYWASSAQTRLCKINYDVFDGFLFLKHYLKTPWPIQNRPNL